MIRPPIRRVPPKQQNSSIFDVAKGLSEITKYASDLKALHEDYSAKLDLAEKDNKSGISTLTDQFKKQALSDLKDATNQLLKKAESELVQIFSYVRGKADEMNGVIQNAKNITKGDAGTPGKDAPLPKKGIDYWTPAEQRAILNELKAAIKPPKDGSPGKDAILTGEVLWAMIDKLPKGKRFKVDHVDGLDQTLSALRNLAARGGVRGGGDSVAAGSNITITTNSTGQKVIATSGGGGALVGSQEKSTTNPNGVLTTFAFTHTPTLIYWNGQFLTLTDDYTVAGNNITFTGSAGVPQTGDKIVNIYA